MKIKKILIMCITVLIVTNNIAFADDVTSIFSNLTPDTGMSNIVTTLLNIVRGVAFSVAAVAIIILGIRYVYSAPDQKAEIKKKAIPFILGACLTFGAATLVNMVYEFASDLI